MTSAAALALVLLYGSTAPLAAALAGANVCQRHELYNRTILEQRPVKVRKYTWCFKVPPRCTVIKFEMRNIDTGKVETEIRNVSECCEGFVAVPQGLPQEEQHCEASCMDLRCRHGLCGPSQECMCLPGYAGNFCQNNCPEGSWGPDCSNKCHCNNCHPQTGLCLHTFSYNITRLPTTLITTTSTSSMFFINDTSSFEEDKEEENLVDDDDWEIEENEKEETFNVTLSPTKINMTLVDLVMTSSENETREILETTTLRPVPSLVLPDLLDEVNPTREPEIPTERLLHRPRELLASLSAALAVALALIVVAIIILALTARRFRARQSSNPNTINTPNVRSTASIVRRKDDSETFQGVNAATATAAAISCKAAVASLDLPLPVGELYFAPVLPALEMAQWSLPPPQILAARRSLQTSVFSAPTSHYDVPPSARASLPASPEPIYDEIPGWRLLSHPQSPQKTSPSPAPSQPPPPLPAANGQTSRHHSFSAV